MLHSGHVFSARLAHNCEVRGLQLTDRAVARVHRYVICQQMIEECQIISTVRVSTVYVFTMPHFHPELESTHKTNAYLSQGTRCCELNDLP